MTDQIKKLLHEYADIMFPIGKNFRDDRMLKLMDIVTEEYAEKIATLTTKEPI